MFAFAASRTAEAVAWFRVMEGTRAEPQLHDPHARAFLGLPLRLATHVRPRRLIDATTLGLPAYIVARHVWMDDRLHAFAPEQVLILGAGFDTRAVRIGKATYWEVDHPATAARKRRLAPGHPARSVEVDFQREGLEHGLARAGFPRGARTFVIWEGVTMYLDGPSVDRTLAVVHDWVGPGSQLVLDALRPPVGRRDRLLQLSARLTFPILGEPLTFREQPTALRARVERAGWAVDAVADAAMLGERIGRSVYPAAYTLGAVWSSRGGAMSTVEAPVDNLR